MLTRGRKCSQGCAKMRPRCLRGVQNAARLSKNAPTMLPRPPRCSQDASEARFGHPKRSPRASLRSSLEAFWVRKSSKLSRGAPKMPPRPPRCSLVAKKVDFEVHFGSILGAFWVRKSIENRVCFRSCFLEGPGADFAQFLVDFSGEKATRRRSRRDRM